jgi:glycosyltransferase involved in cell wall biosynthesis
MAKDILVSICMATYNGEKYLDEQLNSLVNQTYENIEIIIQDDNSSDNTLAIINKYIKTYNNIILSSNQKNLGYQKNFETVIKKSRGEYIAPCDQDDIWELNKIELLLDNIGEFSLIYSDSMFIDKVGNCLDKKFSQSISNKFISSTNSLTFLTYNCVSAHAMMFQKELLDKVLPFPDEFVFDNWISANAASLNGVIFMDKCMVNYRQHDTNALSSIGKKKIKKKNSLERRRKKIEKYINKSNIFLENNLIVQDDIALIRMIIHEYNQFDVKLFNYKLFKLLFLNKNKFFHIRKKNLFLLCFKESLGAKVYKLL